MIEAIAVAVLVLIVSSPVWAILIAKLEARRDELRTERFVLTPCCYNKRAD